MNRGPGATAALYPTNHPTGTNLCPPTWYCLKSVRTRQPLSYANVWRSFWNRVLIRGMPRSQLSSRSSSVRRLKHNTAAQVMTRFVRDLVTWWWCFITMKILWSIHIQWCEPWIWLFDAGWIHYPKARLSYSQTKCLKRFAHVTLLLDGRRQYVAVTLRSQPQSQLPVHTALLWHCLRRSAHKQQNAWGKCCELWHGKPRQCERWSWLCSIQDAYITLKAELQPD